MRIAYVTETYPPEVNGVSLTVARSVQFLRRHGHAVQLIRPRQEGELPLDCATEWRTAGLRLPMYPDLRMGLAFTAAVRQRMRAFDPDVVHVATQGPLGFAAVSAARSAGIPVTSDFRTNFHAYCGHYGVAFASGVVLRYLRSFHNRCALTFVPCRMQRDELEAEGFARVEVMGRGVDARLFTPRRRSDDLREFWGAASDVPVLLYVGRLAAEKNVDLALRAFLAVRKLHPLARMIVVGDGPLRAQLESRYPSAHFAGALYGESLAIHYASADLFLFPSLTETFGNVTLEALASGLGVVAFAAAAAGELIRDRRTGLLAAPGDERAFIDAACNALDPAFGLPQLRARARQSVLPLDWERVLRSFEQRLEQVACDEEECAMQLWLERTVARWADRDLRWTQAVHRIAGWPIVVFTLVFASRLADGVLWYALILTLPVVGGLTGTACAMQMAGVGALNLALYRYLKPRVCRPRPFMNCPGVRACTNALDTYSFPSGHTLHAVSFSIVISFHYPLAALILGPFALVVAVSRLVLGLHYPSDVAVGAAMGLATATLVLAVN